MNLDGLLAGHEAMIRQQKANLFTIDGSKSDW